MLFVNQLPKAEKLEIYKKVKGFCLWEGYPIYTTMQEVLNEKVKDILPIVDYEMSISYIDVYKDYSYGRF